MMHAIAAKAVCFGEAQKPEFARYASDVVDNCQTLSSELSEAGFRLVSGGSDNHLVLVDLTSMEITGQQAETALEKAGIIANKNAIPYDPKPPRVTSGLRLGTPAITSRGFNEQAIKQVARLIVTVLSDLDDQAIQQKAAAEVKELASSFPVPGLDL